MYLINFEKFKVDRITINSKTTYDIKNTFSGLAHILKTGDLQYQPYDKEIKQADAQVKAYLEANAMNVDETTVTFFCFIINTRIPIDFVSCCSDIGQQPLILFIVNINIVLFKPNRFQGS